jgi:L-malate glycosyltransferase
MRRALGISDEELLVLHMSNLRPVKRADFLLRALASARHRDRMRLVILAGGPFEPYEALLDELKLRERVIVTENGATIEDYLQAADAGLYTSESESFGLSILETLYFGKPVVAFRVGGIPEVVGDDARLHDFGDCVAMGASLDEFMESPALRAQLGKRGQERVMAQFNASKIVPRYETIYQRLLAPTMSRA